MRLKVSFDFRVLRGLCYELGGGTVSTQSAKEAFTQATYNAISSTTDNNTLRTSLKRGYTNLNTEMCGHTHNVLVSASDNLIRKCGETRESFPDWLEKVLTNEAHKISSKRQIGGISNITISLVRTPI